MPDSLHWLVKTSPLMMAALDHNMVCRHLSDPWREFLGLPRVHRLSRPIADLFGPENRNLLVQYLEEVVAEDLELVGESVTLKSRNENRAGEISAWRVRMPDSEHPWLVIVARQDPAGASRPGELSRLQSLQQLILNAAGEGILGLDSAGRIRFANESALTTLGWSEQALIGQPMHDRLQHSHKDGSPYLLDDCPIAQTLKTGESRNTREEVFWRADGSALPVAYTSTGISRNGRLDGAVVLFRDISSEQEMESIRRETLVRVEDMNRTLLQERDYLRGEVKGFFDISPTHQSESADVPTVLLGQGEAIQRVRSQIDAIAPGVAHVQVQGEAGVGKIDIARAIHMASKRADEPLIQFNCAALPREHLERELFGSESTEPNSGEQPVAGHWGLARGGTLLLNDITRLPLSVQDRLLREVRQQESEKNSSASEDEVTKGVRIISTSHGDLRREIESGNLREDLYFRTSVFCIEISPLRERLEDVPMLSRRFLNLACQALGKTTPLLTRQQLTRLQAYDWPGNIRELKYVMQRAALLCDGSQLNLDRSVAGATAAKHNTSLGANDSVNFMTDAAVREIEKSNMLAVLHSTSFKVSGKGGAAERLGIKPSTLAYRMRIYGIDKSGQQR